MPHLRQAVIRQLRNMSDAPRGGAHEALPRLRIFRAASLDMQLLQEKAAWIAAP